MGSQQIDVQATTTASPSRVYALLRDGAGWPTWSPIGSFELEQPAADEPEGLGAIRVFITGKTRSRERIAELVENRRFSYELLSGLPLSGYRANVDLTPEGEGTVIRWRSSFDPQRRGTGWFYRLFLGTFIKRTARGLAAYAASEASAPAAASAGAGASAGADPEPESVAPRSHTAA